MALSDPFQSEVCRPALPQARPGAARRRNDASDEDFAKRDIWVRAFWGGLRNDFSSIDQIFDEEAMCGQYRVRVSPARPGDSISSVTSVVVDPGA
jgi:hypothetical protein